MKGHFQFSRFDVQETPQIEAEILSLHYLLQVKFVGEKVGILILGWWNPKYHSFCYLNVDGCYSNCLI